MSTELTVRQAAVLEFIRERLAADGYSPTFREIMDHMGIHSPNGVMVHLKALARKGYITRDDGHARGIRLVGVLPRKSGPTPARVWSLTPAQSRLYRFLASSASMPSVREVMAHMGWTSPNAVVGQLRNLERLGLIRRKDGSARAITVV